MKTLDLPDVAAVFDGRRRGDPPAVLWMHIVMGGGVMYIAAWGLKAFLTFLRSARRTYEQGIAGVVVVLYTFTGLSGLCTVVEAVGDHRGVDIAVVYEVKPFLKIFLSTGAMAVLITQIWLWPLWRHRRQLLARYVEPELVQLRHDLLNLTAAQAELHLDIHHEAYANRAIVEEVVARCRAAGIPPARCAMARMATSLITFHRDNLLQDPSYGLVTSWEALMEDAAAEMDQAVAMTAWEQALRDGYIAQQVYILMFLVLDCRAYREILLIDERPQIQAWHQQMADLIATVMHHHGHATPRSRTLARPTAHGHGVSRLRTMLAGRLGGAVPGLVRPARDAARSLDDREPSHAMSQTGTGEAPPWRRRHQRRRTACPRKDDMGRTVAPLVPGHPTEITAAWLTSVLRSTGVIAPGTRVRTCAHHPIVAVSVSGEVRDDGGGLSGPQLVRLQLAYEGGAGPGQMVAKCGNWGDKEHMPAWPLKSRLIQVIGNLRLEEQFRSEMTFYQDIHPHMQGVRLPRVYYVGMTDAPPVRAWSYVLFDTRTPLRFCVLMEDLAVDHFAAVPLGASLPFAQAQQALINIAQLHAFGWQQPRLWAQLHLRPTPWLTFLRADEGLQRRQRDKFVHTNFMPTFLHRWTRHPGQPTDARGVSLLQEPAIVAMLTALNASFATWADEAATTARLAPQTMVHGDFHGGNHLFNPHDACRLVDFQFFGTGRVADEVAYFFTLSFDPDPVAEEELLRLYHHALVAAGVHGYPYAQFLHEYHVATLTLLLGNLVRATTFLKPSTYDKLAQNRKQAELLQVSELGRARMMRRAVQWYHAPDLRSTFFSVDRWGP